MVGGGLFYCGVRIPLGGAWFFETGVGIFGCGVGKPGIGVGFSGMMRE